MDASYTQGDVSLDELVNRSEIQTLTFRLLCIKRENEQMLRRQEIRYNSTKTSVENLREGLHVAKKNNATLLGEIRESKECFERLQKEFDEMRIRFVACKKELISFKKEKQFQNDTQELIKTTEMRCKRLTKINSNLKILLVKHNVNPDPSSKSNSLSKERVMSPALKRKPINAVAVRRKLTPNKVSWS